MGFDGRVYAVPAPEAVSSPELARVAPEQLEFEFDRLGVQVTLPLTVGKSYREWARRYPRGSPTRTWLEKAAGRREACGSIWQVRVCAHCGAVDTETHRRVALCDQRTCPVCARQASLDLRARLFRAFKKWESKIGRGEPGWFMHTITVRRPSTTSVERLRNDRRRARAGWRVAWKILRKLGATRAVVADEVNFGGMVHLHVLAYHPYVSGDDFVALRAAVLDAVGGGTRQYNVKRAKGNAHKELAKYIVKGSTSPRQRRRIHPDLAVMVEIAWRHLPRVTWFGDWDGLDEVVVDPDAQDGFTWCCPTCGSTGYVTSYVNEYMAPVSPHFHPYLIRTSPGGARDGPSPVDEAPF